MGSLSGGCQGFAVLRFLPIFCAVLRFLWRFFRGFAFFGDFFCGFVVSKVAIDLRFFVKI